MPLLVLFSIDIGSFSNPWPLGVACQSKDLEVSADATGEKKLPYFL